MVETSDSVTQSYGSSCRYQITAPIDRGSYGTVFKARVIDRGDFAGEDIIAVKSVHVFRGISENIEKCAQLQQKLKHLLDIKHAHLVRYHKLSIISHAGVFSEYRLIMDYYSDGDLTRYLNDLKVQLFFLREDAVVGYATQLADGLTFLHENNIIHGDLKPANVLVKRMQNTQNILRIGDFDDSVRMRRDITTARDISNLRGTYRYMSPEMLGKYYAYRIETAVGRKTDVWSLGCVVLDLVNARDGRYYIFNQSKGEKLECSNGKISDIRFADLVADGWVPYVPDTISKFLGDYIRKCLRVNSVIRISAGELLKMLQSKRLNDSLGSGIMDSSAIKQQSCVAAVAPASSRSRVQKITEMFENKVQIRTRVREDTKLTTSDGGILVFHHTPGNRIFAVQWIDSALTVHPIPFPEALRDEKIKILPTFRSADNEVIMQLIQGSSGMTGDHTTVIGWRPGDTTWRIISRTQSARQYTSAADVYRCSAVVVGSDVYYWNGDSQSASLGKFSLNDGAFTDLPDPEISVPAERTGQLILTQLLRYGDNIICCADDSTLKFVRCFDTQLNMWHFLPDMPGAVRGFVSIVLGEYMYILLGTTVTTTEEDTCYRYNLNDHVWERFADLSVARSSGGVFGLNGHIYLYGGHCYSDIKELFKVVRTMEMYDPERNLWSKVQYKDNDGRNLELLTCPQTICVHLNEKPKDAPPC